jgi:hypothetical protein
MAMLFEKRIVLSALHVRDVWERLNLFQERGSGWMVRCVVHGLLRGVEYRHESVRLDSAHRVAYGHVMISSVLLSTMINILFHKVGSQSVKDIKKYLDLA